MPPYRPRIESGALLEGSADIPSDALFEQVHVDKGRLRAHVDRALQARRQVSLGELLESHPLQQGLAELLAYFVLATEDGNALIEDGRPQHVAWVDAGGAPKQATVPTVLFSRPSGATGATR